MRSNDRNPPATRARMMGRNILLIVAVLLASCASNSIAPQLDAATLVGHWQNRSGGFFRLSWDQCEFLANRHFTCTSYPLKGELMLTYDGTWSLADGQLHLSLQPGETYIYYIIKVGRDSFTIDSRLSGVRTFYRIKDIN